MTPTDDQCTLPTDLNRWDDDGGRTHDTTVSDETHDRDFPHIVLSDGQLADGLNRAISRRDYCI